MRDFPALFHPVPFQWNPQNFSAVSFAFSAIIFYTVILSFSVCSVNRKIKNLRQQPSEYSRDVRSERSAVCQTAHMSPTTDEEIKKELSRKWPLKQDIGFHITAKGISCRNYPFCDSLLQISALRPTALYTSSGPGGGPGAISSYSIPPSR